MSGNTVMQMGRVPAMPMGNSTQLLFAGRYHLERPIGSGRTSTVWRAWDATLDRPVAVKVVSVALLPDLALRARLLKETRIAAGLTHPGLPLIYDFGEASVPGGSDISFIVMELIEGDSLAARLARGPLPLDEASQVCGAAAEALATAHDAGLVHRDVQPANIFLTANGVRVLGLGTSHTLEDPRQDGSEASPYTAPEQLDGGATAAADVYALGVVLTEAVTGRLPSEEALPADVPDNVSLLCARCCAPDPTARPTAAQIAEVLAATAFTKTTATDWKSYTDPPEPKTVRTAAPSTRLLATAARKRRRLERVATASAPILLIMLFLGAGEFLRDRPPIAVPNVPMAVPVQRPAAVPPDPTTTAPEPPPVPSTPVPAQTPAQSQAPPRTARTVAPLPPERTPTQISVDDALNLVRQSVYQGLDAREIRPDVGLDLNNVVADLQRDLARGQQVDLARRIGEIRAKIHTRFREGGITQGRANTLNYFLPTV